MLAFYCTIGFSLSWTFSIASSVEAHGLRKGDRTRLAAEFAGGSKEVMVLIAAKPGANPRVVYEIERSSGKIHYREDSVDYIRAYLPVTQVEKISTLEVIESITVGDENVHFTGDSNELENSPFNFSGNNGIYGQLSQDSLERPGPDTPAENPFVPTMYAGAPQFVARHPTFDGRGVVIAVIDGFPDILHPVLQSAKSLDGKPVPKLLDAKMVIDPTDFGFDTRFFVNMWQEVVADTATVNYQEKSYTVPANGRYRIGTLQPTPPGRVKLLDRPLVALWDERAGNVWVDTNLDFNFANEKAMTDYHIRHDVGIIGQDDPTTPARETTAFIIQTYPKDHYIGINLMNDTHGSIIAGVAAGKGFFGSQANGMAPEAQIVSIEKGRYTLAGTIEAMIYAFKHPKTDIITMQAGMDAVVRDGDTTLGIISDRLVEKYRKPFFSSAGNNGSGLNVVSEGSSGRNVISVGSYLHRDTLRTVLGVSVRGPDCIAELSSRGPRDDGQFKPDLLAPVGGIGSDFLNPEWGILPGHYRLPPGYVGMYTAGTSYAAPTASGAAALLISAAKQSGVVYDAGKIRWALTTTARRLPGYQPYEQGNGLIDVEAAWEALKHAPDPINITSKAPVKTIKSSHLRKPDQGVGIYEREGWAAGQSGRRTITFTRTSGSPKPMKFALRWIRNDGTFTTVDQITLPLNKPVAIPININRQTNGVHNSVLELVDPASSQPVYRVMNTVVAAEQFTADKKGVIKVEGKADWMGHRSYFFNIPSGTSAVKFESQILGGSMRMRFYDPNGTGDGYWPRGLFEMEAWPTQYKTEGKLGRAFINPLPGVWEVIIQNDTRFQEVAQTQASPPATFTLTASIYNTSATQSVVSPSSAKNEGDSTEISFKNNGGSFTGRVADAPLGSSYSDKPTLRQGEYKVYEVNVAPGTKRLAASIAGSNEAKADLDLYVFNGSKKYEEFASWMHSQAPVLVGYSADEGSDESVSIDNPQPGKWKVVISAASVPSGRTSVEYQDIVTNPIYGMIKSTDVTATHNHGEQWAGRVQLELGKIAPAPGKCLAGLVEVTSEDVAINFTNGNPSWRSDSTAGLRWPVSLGTALINVEENKCSGFKSGWNYAKGR